MTTAPVGFILTFFRDFVGHVGMRVPGSPVNVQAVRSIDEFYVDPDNGLDVMVVTSFAGNRSNVTLDWLTAVRPATLDVVGNPV